MRKRLITLGLAIVMLLLLVPMRAYAAFLVPPWIEKTEYILGDSESYIKLTYLSAYDIKVQYSKDGGSWQNANGRKSSDPVYRHYTFGVNGSGSYRIRAASVDGGSRGDWVYKSRTIPKNNMDQIENFSARLVAYNIVELTWDKVTGVDKLYVWYESEKNDNKIPLDTSRTSYTLHLSPETEYEVGVEAGKNYSSGYMYTQRKDVITTEDKKPVISSSTTFKKSFNSRHKITVEAKFDGQVTTRITDSSGDTVINIESNKFYSAGSHSVYWEGTDSSGDPVPSGTYNIVAIERDSGDTYYIEKELIYEEKDLTKTTNDEIIEGKLHRTFRHSSGNIQKVAIYYGEDDSFDVRKINYYSNGIRTSYKLYNPYWKLKNFVQLRSDGKVKKTNYYDLNSGVRTSYKLYDTEGRITHLISCHPDGVKPKKTNYYNVSTGERKSYKLYDTQGRTTHYAFCYSDGVKARKMNYYDVNTGKRSAYKTYRTDGSCSCHVICDSYGNPSKATYYDKDGDVTKVGHY